MKYFLIKCFFPLFRKIESVLKLIDNEEKTREVDIIKGRLQNCGKNLRVEGELHIYGEKYISIGDNVLVGPHFRIEAIDSWAGDIFTPSIHIGDGVSFGYFCHIGCIEKVSIGNGTMFGSKVYITDHEHGQVSKEEIGIPPAKRHLYHKPVTIGENVWVGDGVCILPNVSIGNNVVIGANAVVTHSFPANVVIAGCPAKIIKSL